MLILFVVLLDIAASGNKNITHSVDYDIQPSTNVIIGESYNLTCIVKDQQARVAFWLKNGEKLEKRADDTTRENGTMKVTYRITNFSSMDVGNYSCAWKYRKQGQDANRHGEVLELDYRKGQREDPTETEETEPITFTEKPRTTAFTDRNTCKLIKIDRPIYNWDKLYYAAGDVLTIPKDRLFKSEVLTIKAEIRYYRGYGEDWDREQWRNDNSKPRWDNDKYGNKRRHRQGFQSFNDDPNGKPKSIGETAPNITGDLKDLVSTTETSKSATPQLHDITGSQNKGNDEVTTPEHFTKEYEKKITKYNKVLSIEKQNGSNRQNDSINVYTRKTTRRGQTLSTNWGVNGTLNRPFRREVFQLEQNTDLKLQMVYNSATQSLEIITPHTTRSITVPSDDLRNLTQISIGDDINRQGITIQYISICQLVKPSISLTVDVKKEALNLICTATGPPFLTGYWKMGERIIQSNHYYFDYGRRLVTEQLNEKDALQTLTLTLTLSPSELQIKEYSCHVSSTSSRDTEVIEVIKLRGDDYRNIIRKVDCQRCGSGSGGGGGGGGGADTAGGEEERDTRNYYTGNKERSVNIALGCLCGLLFLMILAQISLNRIYKRNKRITQEEEGELSTVTKWERQVERYKAFGLYSENFNPDYDEMRRNKQKNKTDAEGEGGDKKEGEGADKTEEKKEDTKKNKEEERELTPSEIQIERYKSFGL